MTDAVRKKKEQILKGAAEIFGKDGYRGSRMADIAKAAGVSPRTLYKYFDNKKQLFLEVREWAMQTLIEDLLDHAKLDVEEGDSIEIFRSMLSSYSTFGRRHKRLAHILAEAIAEFEDPEIMEAQRETFAGGVYVVASMIEEDVEAGRLELLDTPENISWVFLAFATLLVYSMVLDLDRVSEGSFDPKKSLDLFFQAMTPPESGG